MKYSKGDFIDSYKVYLPLKEGEVTSTYRAKTPKGRLVVIKTCASAEEKEIAKLTNLFLASTDDYLVMRHISGESLESRLNRMKKIGFDDALSLTEELLSQMEAIHSAGYLHAGLTPDNVMLDLMNSPMSLYIIGGSRSHKADSFTEDTIALGKIIYRMLTGDDFSGPMRVQVSRGSHHKRPVEMAMRGIAGEFESAMEMSAFLKGANEGKQDWRPTTGPGFSAVAGMNKLKQQLQDDVINILADAEGAKRYGLTIPNGMLLYGPPGCGKTFISERFAEEAGYNYKYVKSSDLASIYLHGSQEKIAELFEEARKNSPTILCIDEFDALVPRRDNINNASQSAEVNEFLSQLNNCGNSGVFVIATSNRPDKIDPAILRTGRIDYKIYVDLPDDEAREEMFRLSLKDRPVEDSIDYSRLSKATSGFLSSDIAAITSRAAREAFRQKSDITQAALIQAISEIGPSISKSTIMEYEKMRKEFETKSNSSERRSAGFRIF